ncbi:hypothetical protein F4009_05340 [Candidatus Poribacteria bacterium]|nr:hypothetical protein [Candidatus Poribacteria bacterium]
MTDKIEAIEKEMKEQRGKVHRLEYLTMLAVEMGWDVFYSEERVWNTLRLGGFVCGAGERPYSELFVCGPSESGNRVIAGWVPEGFKQGSEFDVWLPDGTFAFSEHGFGPHKMTIGQGWFESSSGRVGFSPKEGALLEDMCTIVDRFGWGRWKDPYRA